MATDGLPILRGRVVRAAVGLATLICIGGCAAYDAMPITASKVDAALAARSDQDLQVAAGSIDHRELPSVPIDLQQGLTPESAAIVAVIANPELRALRDQRLEARAAVFRAGILPNPQLTGNYQFVTGGNTLGAVNAFGYGLDYDLTALIARGARKQSARANAESIDLLVAWQEWQAAEAAKSAAYDLISLQAQLRIARQIDGRLQQNRQLIWQATDEHLKTALDLAAAQAAADDSRTTVLQITRDVEHQRQQLNRAMGLPPATPLRLRADLSLDDRLVTPTYSALLSGLESRRLDLIALRRGYQSQEQTLRAEVLSQFPKINLGFERDSDDTNVHLIGPTLSIDLPLFDRNQGAIAAEKATRQRLYDEYTSRVFEARADIAAALADVAALNVQIAQIQSALPELKQLVNVYRQAVDRRSADILSYYQAWNELAQKQLDLLRLEQQLADNRVALEIAAGKYLPASASASPSTAPSTTSARSIVP